MNMTSLKALSELINALTVAAEQQKPVTLTVGCPVGTITTTLLIEDLDTSDSGIVLTDPDGEEYTIHLSGEVSQPDTDSYTIASGECVLAIEFNDDREDPDE